MAHPELAITPLSPYPFVLRVISLLTVTDAAGNSFLVKTAAPHEGVSDATRIKSGCDLLAGFIPALMLPTRKPFGYVPVDGTNLCLLAGMGELP